VASHGSDSTCRNSVSNFIIIIIIIAFCLNVKGVQIASSQRRCHPQVQGSDATKSAEFRHVRRRREAVVLREYKENNSRSPAGSPQGQLTEEARRYKLRKNYESLPLQAIGESLPNSEHCTALYLGQNKVKEHAIAVAKLLHAVIHAKGTSI